MVPRSVPDHAQDHGAGITFAFARLCLGIWSFLVPVIAAAGFSNVALILVIFLSISGVVGFLFMPNYGRQVAGRPGGGKLWRSPERTAAESTA